MGFDLEVAALTIDEILSRSYRPVASEGRNQDIALERLHHWKKIGSDGSNELFGARLQRLGIELDDLTAKLGGVERDPREPEPQWVSKVLNMLALMKAGTEGPQYRDIPFGPLLVPVIQSAISEFKAGTSSHAMNKLSACACQKIVDHLVKRLSNLFEMPFYECLLRWRSGRIVAAKEGDPSAATDIMALDLGPFARHMCDRGFDELLQRKPILFRLAVSLIDQWMVAYSEFVIRLDADWDALGPLLGTDELGLVETLDWGLSDPHNGGHSVLSLVFGSGHRVLYKPKHLETDVFVREFVSQLSAMGLRELHVPEVLSRDGYGWTGFIRNEPCLTEDDVGRYYERFGAWLAVLYVLGSSDMHMENFLACGSHPIPVDFETILQGLRQRPETTDMKTEAAWLASHFLEDSVQSVGMLPTYIQDQQGNLISQGALEPSEYNVSLIEWEEMNTPRMVLRSSTRTERISSNLPVLNEQPVGVSKYRHQFANGFTEALQFIQEHARSLQIDWGRIEDLTIRRVLRPTRFYYMLMKRLYDCRRMNDAVIWSMEADFIARFFDWDERAEQPWKVLKSERRQLLELNIPYFTMRAGDNIIYDKHGPITRLHVDLGPDVFRSRLTEGWSKANSQCEIVRASLQLMDSMESHGQRVSTAEEFVNAIRDEIVLSAFKSSESMLWITRLKIDHDTAAQINLIGHDLYYGTSGIGLFFAALHEQGDPDASAFARMSVARILKAIQSGEVPKLTRSIGIGGMVGLGSIAYGLSRIAVALGDEEILEAAVIASKSVSDEAIEADNRFDLVAGAAGAVLSLLSLHQQTPNDWIVGRAKACADHLLRKRDRQSGMWSSADFKQPLTGAAHGAAGIASAFSSLYRITGEEVYKSAAQDCIAFENTFYDSERLNWRDPRDAGSFPNQWCYGAVGIGMLRLSMLGDGAVSEDVLMQDVEAAIQASVRLEQKNHTMCCGLGGTIEFLSMAASRMGKHDLRNLVDMQVGGIISHWNRYKDFHSASGTKHLNPGLLQGLAGVGYAVMKKTGSRYGSPLSLM